MGSREAHGMNDQPDADEQASKHRVFINLLAAITLLAVAIAAV
jgi:hypothetical protein